EVAAGGARRPRDEAVHADPLGAVVPVADHQPEVAVPRQHAAPLRTEVDGEPARVALGGRASATRDPVGRRGHDHAHAPGGDPPEPPAVPADEANVSVSARGARERRGGAPARSGGGGTYRGE